MAKNLLERLSQERPHWGQFRNVSLSRVREFVEVHKHEIEEARVLGYSWEQINTAIRELYSDNEVFSNIHWRKTNLIEDIYREMSKKQRRALIASETAKDSLEFNVKVTKAKR